VTPLDYDYLRKAAQGPLRPRSLGRQAVPGGEPSDPARPQGRHRDAHRAGSASSKRNNERLIVDVVEAMTTNESFFYRDKVPFDHFRDAIMPALLAARAKEAAPAHLVCGRIDRPGALFARDVPEDMKDRSPAGASRLSARTCRPKFWRRPKPGSTASSKCSAACRSRCW